MILGVPWGPARNHVVNRFANDPGTDLVAQVGRAIGAAQDELWPVRRGNVARLRPEDLHGRAAAAALAVVRQAIGRMEPPETLLDGEAWGACRLAVLRMLGAAG